MSILLMCKSRLHLFGSQPFFYWSFAWLEFSFAADESLFHLNLPHSSSLSIIPEVQWSYSQQRQHKRIVEGILAALLSHKKHPFIRYQASSSLCKKTAIAVTHKIKEEGELFHFGGGAGNGCLLLIVDRTDDPITPLLTQWTYQVNSIGFFVCLCLSNFDGCGSYVGYGSWVDWNQRQPCRLKVCTWHSPWEQVHFSKDTGINWN